MAKKGAKYTCETCGVVMVVDKACGCTPCDLICCGALMKESKQSPRLSRKLRSDIPLQPARISMACLNKQ